MSQASTLVPPTSATAVSRGTREPTATTMVSRATTLTPFREVGDLRGVLAPKVAVTPDPGSSDFQFVAGYGPGQNVFANEGFVDMMADEMINSIGDSEDGVKWVSEMSSLTNVMPIPVREGYNLYQEPTEKTLPAF